MTHSCHSLGKSRKGHLHRHLAQPGELHHVRLALRARLGLPRFDRPARQSLGAVWNGRVVIYGDHPPKSLAGRARPNRMIETEQRRRRLPILQVATPRSAGGWKNVAPAKPRPPPPANEPPVCPSQNDTPARTPPPTAPGSTPSISPGPEPPSTGRAANFSAAPATRPAPSASPSSSSRR
jgi:hypothetical protein